MPRPSQAQDQALLAAGAALYAELGCAKLSVRRVAEHAGVNPAMVHYHFGSKSGFLRALLQQHYEQMFASLSLEAQADAAPLVRLQAALFALARFVREHRALIGRLWQDTQSGEAVALEFLRANAPRHVKLLGELAAAAEARGQLSRQPPLTRLSFLMGAVLAPILIGGGVRALGLAPKALAAQIEPQILSDAALRARIDLALKALS